MPPCPPRASARGTRTPTREAEVLRPTSVLATVTGRDRPGVTAAFFAALAAHDVDVRDVEQVVIRDRLVLTVLFDLRGDPGALRSSATNTAHALGMECDVTVADEAGADRDDRDGVRTHVLVIGRPLRPGAVSHVAQRIADLGANIDSISQLTCEPHATLELMVRTREPARLRAALVHAAEDTGVDIAVESAQLLRRAKRLVLLDGDTTVFEADALAVLAERAGVHGDVEQLAARVTAGDLDAADALRARVGLLAGLPLSEVERVRDEIRFRPDADAFVRTLRRLGYRVGVVSSGFTLVTDRCTSELGVNFAAANRLEIVDGAVTGNIVGDVVAGAAKAEALIRFADSSRVPLSQTVAVGSGPDDVAMLQAAGLAIAFNVTSALRSTDELPYLDPVLFALGISADDVAVDAAR